MPVRKKARASRPAKPKAKSSPKRKPSPKPKAKSPPKRKPSPKPKAKSSREKVRAHRQRLRAQGLRPIQIWVPDTRSPEFAAEARRQSLAIANSPQEEEDQAFVDAISEWHEEE
jgi:hypothetical protein